VISALFPTSSTMRALILGQGMESSLLQLVEHDFTS